MVILAKLLFPYGESSAREPAGNAALGNSHHLDITTWRSAQSTIKVNFEPLPL